MPLADPTAWTKTPMRLFVLLCALALAAASIVAAAEPAFAATISTPVSRASVLPRPAPRTTMHAPDAAGRATDGPAQVGSTRKLKRAEKERNKQQAPPCPAKAVLVRAQRAPRTRVEAQYASPNDAPFPDIYRERLQTLRGRSASPSRARRT